MTLITSALAWHPQVPGGRLRPPLDTCVAAAAPRHPPVAAAGSGPDPRWLTQELKRSDGVVGLLEMHEKYGDDFNHIHLSAAWVTLSRHSQAGKAGARSRHGYIRYRQVRVVRVRVRVGVRVGAWVGVRVRIGVGVRVMVRVSVRVSPRRRRARSR